VVRRCGSDDICHTIPPLGLFGINTAPNARLHLPLEAGATQERRLEAVRCKPWLGTGPGTGLRRGASLRPPHDGPQAAVTAPREATPAQATPIARRCRGRLDLASGGLACPPWTVTHAP